MTRLFGILNLTRDSFSDGGRFLNSADALVHARRLHEDGADVLDVGAESTHPDAEAVPADVEIARLLPVVEPLRAAGASISIDTHKPAVMSALLPLGVDFINDVTGFRNPAAVEAVAGSAARLVVMHARHADLINTRAERIDEAPADLVHRIRDFFGDRIEELTRAGIARNRLILDPGMGFFLSSNPAASLTALRDIDRLLVFGCPLLVSVSRKSFIGATLGGDGPPRPIDERGAGTLAAELWAAAHGVSYIRTHDVRATRDALSLWRAIAT